MPFVSNKNIWFAGLAVAVLFAFFCFRPLNAPAYRIIAADGLGYYSYLPARFIYQDADFQFEWFDDVFIRHYNNSMFARPSDNFMVQYGDRRIDKYYPGQSLLQLPFFFLAHLSAKLTGQPADGFSLPYQAGIGLAAVFYALAGLFFCSKLLLQMFNNRFISILVPLLVFSGTNLFTYTIFNGCYSHVYSFFTIALALYSAFLFFQRTEKKLLYLSLLVLFSVLTLSIRPLNALLLLSIFYFYKPFSLKELGLKGVFKPLPALFLLLACLAAGYTLQIIHRQTGGFFINSYAGERFYFDRWSHVAGNLFGFQYGMLWYVPLILLALAALVFVRRQPRLLWLLLPVLCSIVLYSLWWYWSIVARTIVDASAPIALLLAVLLLQLRGKKSYKPVLAVALLCVPLFQLKAYQLRNNILDNHHTYFNYYARHFFTLRPVNVFPVNPATVRAQETYYHEAYGQGNPQVLDAQQEYACTSHYTVPAISEGEGIKKIRTSFSVRASGKIDNLHLVFVFKAKDGSELYFPFYMKAENLRKDRWEDKEYGLELPSGIGAGDRFSLYFWNPGHKDEALIDNLKTEFFLTDFSEESTLK